MFREILHKSFSILMAVLVLFSTVSFTVEKHYCAGNLIDVAIFSKVKKCGDNLEGVSMKSCCEDEVEIVKGQDDLQFSSFEDIDLENQIFITSFLCSYSNLFESLPKQIIPFKDYSPPNLVYDIQVLDQVFLI